MTPSSIINHSKFDFADNRILKRKRDDVSKLSQYRSLPKTFKYGLRPQRDQDCAASACGEQLTLGSVS